MRAYHKTPEKFRSAGEKTHGKGKHKAHKIGDRISFKTPKGRTSGKIVGVHKEFYTVVNKNIEYKVNRNSILYLMGTKKITDVNGQQVNTGPAANSIPQYNDPLITDQYMLGPYGRISPPYYPLYKLKPDGTRPIDAWGRRMRYNSHGQLIDSKGNTSYKRPPPRPGEKTFGPILNDVKYAPRGPRPKGI